MFTDDNGNLSLGQMEYHRKMRGNGKKSGETNINKTRTPGEENEQKGQKILLKADKNLLLQKVY